MRYKKRKKSPVLIGKVFEELLNSKGLKKRYLYNKAVLLWREVVDKNIATQTKATRVEQGRLMVFVENPILRQELHFEKLSIISKINSKLGEKAIREIVLY